MASAPAEIFRVLAFTAGRESSLRLLAALKVRDLGWGVGSAPFPGRYADPGLRDGYVPLMREGRAFRRTVEAS